LFIGNNDLVASPENGLQIREQLMAAGAAVNAYTYNNFGHETFVWGTNMDWLNQLEENIANPTNTMTVVRTITFPVAKMNFMKKLKKHHIKKLSLQKDDQKTLTHPIQY